MQQPHVLKGGIVADALGIEAREQGRRCGAVKTLVVKEDPDLQK